MDQSSFLQATLLYLYEVLYNISYEAKTASVEFVESRKVLVSASDRLSSLRKFLEKTIGYIIWCHKFILCSLKIGHYRGFKFRGKQ